MDYTPEKIEEATTLCEDFFAKASIVSDCEGGVGVNITNDKNTCIEDYMVSNRHRKLKDTCSLYYIRII